MTSAAAAVREAPGLTGLLDRAGLAAVVVGGWGDGAVVEAGPAVAGRPVVVWVAGGRGAVVRVLPAGTPVGPLTAHRALHARWVAAGPLEATSAVGGARADDPGPAARLARLVPAVLAALIVVRRTGRPVTRTVDLLTGTGRSVPDGLADLDPGAPVVRSRGVGRERDMAHVTAQESALSESGLGVLGPLQGVRWDLPGTVVTYGESVVPRTGGGRQVHWGGHATSVRASRTAGLLEGLERLAPADPDGRADLRTASLAELAAAGAEAVDPAACGLYSEEFHRAHPQVPRWDPTAPTTWVRGRRLVAGGAPRPVWVHRALALHDAAAPGERFVEECSSGCASGASLAEAALHGVLELLERDAFLRAFFGSAGAVELRPDAATPAPVQHLLRRMEFLGFRVRFFEVPTGFGPVVVVAVATDLGGGGGACVGAGAAFDTTSAARAALAEVASDAPTIATRRTARRAELEAMAEDHSLVRRLADHADLYCLPRMVAELDRLDGGTRTSWRVAVDADRDRLGWDVTSLDLAGNLDRLVGRFAEQGMAVAVVDQTTRLQERLGVRTARAVVPGLLPIDFGAGRQRCFGMARSTEVGGPAREADSVPHPFP
ncbi:YcaO-like family protein [Kineococcus sp. LSe6-4]|uniref:YcaO-like family protein n=1 Tax=Kineococcus halophytocola TaxID=3234027 RepID=A0ABV4H539_9ACTN